MTVLAAYVVTHGQLTPGGGFQGGVILMAAVAFVCAGRRVPAPAAPAALGHAARAGRCRRGGGVRHHRLRRADRRRASFFANFIPKGSQGSLLSGGMIPLANIAVGVEVAGALLMVLSELLDQRLLHGSAR